MSLTCLNNIVGLSSTSCNCWDAEKPVDFNTLNASSSGLYVAAADTTADTTTATEAASTGIDNTDIYDSAGESTFILVCIL